MLLLLALSGCFAHVDPPPRPPSRAADCIAACDHAISPAPRGLGCAGTIDGCVGICERVTMAGYPLDLDCVVAAKDCDAVDACD